ncbi:MAG: DUF6502 family protein [Rubrivivax sp.]
MSDSDSLDAALAEAIARLLGPVARLAVARGMTFQQLQELVKQALVQQARAAEPQAGHRDVSRVATMTGLTRREVTRLSAQRPAVRAERSSPATQLFTRWAADGTLRDDGGAPAWLPRRGPAPSFETLAREVTQDVHPRRLLDELLRLGLVEHDEQSDRVRLLKDAFVPDADAARMLGFVGANAGDHLAASVANALGDERRHFEQAVFVSGLSDESVSAAKKLVQTQWRALTAALVPELEALFEADERQPPPHPRRLRIGLYSYDEETRDDEASDS